MSGELFIYICSDIPFIMCNDVLYILPFLVNINKYMKGKIYTKDEILQKLP